MVYNIGCVNADKILTVTIHISSVKPNATCKRDIRNRRIIECEFRIGLECADMAGRSSLLVLHKRKIYAMQIINIQPCLQSNVSLFVKRHIVQKTIVCVPIPVYVDPL